VNQPKRLYRSRYDTIIGGVAGGLAEYFEIDVLIVRILFVVLAFAAAGGVLLYLILWIVIPINPDYRYRSFNHFKTTENMENKEKENDKTTSEQQQNVPPPPPPFYPSDKDKNEGNLIAGIALITIGGMFLVDRFVPQIDFGDLWPLLLIVAGILIMRKHF